MQTQEFDQLVAQCQPHTLFTHEFMSYWASDFAHKFLAKVVPYEATKMLVYDGAELFEPVPKATPKTFALENGKKPEVYVYTYPEGVPASEKRQKIDWQSKEVGIFMELSRDEQVKINLNFGRDLEVFLEKHFRENNIPKRASDLTKQSYHKTLAEIQDFLKESLLQDTLIRFVFELVGIKVESKFLETIPRWDFGWKLISWANDMIYNNEKVGGFFFKASNHKLLEALEYQNMELLINPEPIKKRNEPIVQLPQPEIWVRGVKKVKFAEEMTYKQSDWLDYETFFRIVIKQIRKTNYGLLSKSFEVKEDNALLGEHIEIVEKQIALGSIQAKVYRVQPGDGLIKIADVANKRVKEIIALNKDEDLTKFLGLQQIGWVNYAELEQLSEEEIRDDAINKRKWWWNIEAKNPAVGISEGDQYLIDMQLGFKAKMPRFELGSGWLFHKPTQKYEWMDRPIISEEYIYIGTHDDLRRYLNIRKMERQERKKETFKQVYYQAPSRGKGKGMPGGMIVNLSTTSYLDIDIYYEYLYLNKGSLKNNKLHCVFYGIKISINNVSAILPNVAIIDSEGLGEVSYGSKKYLFSLEKLKGIQRADYKSISRGRTIIIPPQDVNNNNVLNYVWIKGKFPVMGAAAKRHLLEFTGGIATYYHDWSIN